MKYIRTCQECGHKQEAKDPGTYSAKTSLEHWRNLKCQKCKSEAMDFGSLQEISNDRSSPQT